MVPTRTKITDEIARRWNQPPEERLPGDERPEYFRDWDVKPEDVLRRLRAEFTEPAIEEAVSTTLNAAAETYERGAVPDGRSLFLANCCLSLVTCTNGVSLSKSVAKAVVRTFASVGWYKPVGELIRKQLSAAEVLDVLLAGLKNGCDKVCMSCLAGLQFYRGIAKTPGDRNRLCESTIQIQRVVETLKTHQSSAVRELALESSISDWLK